MSTPEPTNETRPSQLNQWIIDHRERVEAAKEALAALARHLPTVPDPQNENETKTLLDWRYQHFRIGHEPIGEEGIRLAAPTAAELLDGARHEIILGARQLLANIENVMRIDARDNKNGLFSPTGLQASNAVITRGQYAYTRLSMLPAGHPLRSLGEHPRLSEICLGPTTAVSSLDGTERRTLPAWRTVAALRAEVEAERAEEDRRAEREREEAREHLEREELAKLRNMTLEQRQILALESKVAKLQAQLAQPKLEHASCSS